MPRKEHTLRLSAIKAFLSYAAGEDITLVTFSQAAKTLKAPTPPRASIEYLSEDETRGVLAAHTGRSAKSRRNRMLLIGSVSAAATTSLPENREGTKNYDHRLAWVRDATYSLRSVIQLAEQEDVHAAVSWTLRIACWSCVTVAARCEDRIRNAKDMGLMKFPLQSFAQNQVWCQIVQLASEMVSWMQTIALTGHDAREWEPKRLRARLFEIPAILVRRCRHKVLHLARHAPEAVKVLTGVDRVRAAVAQT